MYSRLINPSLSHSFFLFGPRGTGKSTWLLNQFFESQKKSLKNNLSDNTKVLYLDLLDPSIEQVLSVHPNQLEEMVEARNSQLEWVIIDEIQKIPKLLDVVHKLIFSKKLKFALTGSSARKLKRDAANLLAGRAFSYQLHPLTFVELGKNFNLNQVLSYGSLPSLFSFHSDSDKRKFLLSYLQIYIKEEILVEQLIRNIDPFRSFLEVAGQCNTEIINYTNIAREAGISSKSVERYFAILSDTFLGFFLEPYSKSVRQRQKQAPKFYFFDCGIARAISQEINIELSPKTYEYGKLFEQYVIVEIFRLNHYYEKNWKFSYLRTGAGVEIDLIIEKSKKEIILVEIKSADHIQEEHLSGLKNFSDDFPTSKKYLLCRAKIARVSSGIKIMNYLDGMKEIFSL
ncbi:MAG: AAA family ATPase [Bacteriovoracaceae bacterium]|nr:AAA family ATPase [Bacteriovoracaceae bacterium]